MTGKIYLPCNLRGGLGNQLFAVNMALQLSKHFDVPVSLPFTLTSKVLKLPSVRFVSTNRFITHKGFRLDRKEFLSKSDSTLLSEIEQYLLNKEDVIVPPDILGEGFFSYWFMHPGDVVPLRYNCLNVEYSESVALHFRGTDFANWNPLAIMDHSFYMNSIEFLNVTNLKINIFSDEPGSSTVKNLLKSLPNGKLFPEASLKKTFSALSQHRYVIASPSTFSFWAALLGRSSTLIISKNWVDEMESKGDKFWPQVAKNEKFYFDEVFAL